MPGSTGSGDLTAGDEGPSFCCSTEDGLSERFKSEHMKVFQTRRDFYLFAAQVKSQVVLQESFVHPSGCLEGQQTFSIENEDLSNRVFAILPHGRLLIATSVNNQHLSNL